MSNIIHVNFAERRAFLSAKESYLYIVAANLDELDYQDFVEAVNDPTGTVYLDMDKEMQILVDSFFAQEG